MFRRLSLIISIFAATGMMLLWSAWGQFPRRVALTERFDPRVEAYAFIIPNQKPVEGANALKAGECGKCHKAIYREWRASTHASSLRDIQFQAELSKPDSPKWICLNCHIPVQNQREYIVTHLEEGDIFKPVTRPNPLFDPHMQQEGVTCATCHVRTDKTTGKSFIIGPNGSTEAPHPVRQNRQFLHNICLRCHDPRGEALTPNLVCWFYTRKELQEARPLLEQKLGKSPDCVDCHMPTTRRLIAEDFPHLPHREVNQHHWVGSGIPKWYEGYDSLLVRGYRPGLEVTAGKLSPRKPGRTATLPLTLTNARAGHYLPTGDPERFLLVVVAIEDKSGRRQWETRRRIGQIWEWNPARKLGDNRLKYGESRQEEIPIPLPENLSGLLLTIQVYHVRVRTETARYMIASAPNVDEKLFPGGRKYVRETATYYPLATIVFREEIDLSTGKRRRYSLRELIELSKREREKPLTDRDY